MVFSTGMNIGSSDGFANMLRRGKKLYFLLSSLWSDLFEFLFFGVNVAVPSFLEARRKPTSDNAAEKEKVQKPDDIGLQDSC